MPTVSVIMPVYNVERFVADSIRSVLAQDFADFELILVDDAATDRSPEICAGFTDPRIRMVHQANRGLAGARNTGIRHSRGHYLAFLDSDDLWHPQKLSRHVAHLDSRPEIGVSYSASAMIDDSGRLLGLSQRPKLTDIRPEDVLCRNPIGNGSAPVIRRAVFDAIAVSTLRQGAKEMDYFDEAFRQSEDIECWLRIAVLTRWKLEGLGAELTYYRINEGGLSANLERQYESWERFIAKAQTYAPALIRAHGARARGFQLRYLARRAIKLGDGPHALKLVARALRTAPRILIEEPARTVVTLCTACLQAALSERLFKRIETAILGRPDARASAVG